MTITGPLDLGAAQIIQRDTGEILGYVYTVANGKGQLQRWLLYKNPENSFEVRQPPPSKAGWSLSDWQANVPGLWQEGSFYVWAQADVYRHGDGSNGTWTEIPPENQLPKPTFPQVPGVCYQLDYTRLRILEVIQEQSRGLAYSVGSLTDESSAEYWLLNASYQPAGASATAGIADGAMSALSLQQFVDTANKSFGPGCLLAITGCANYTGSTAPAMP